MKTRNFNLLHAGIIAFFVMFCLSNCKKTDQPFLPDNRQTQPEVQPINSIFFGFVPSDPLTTAIRSYVMQEELEHHFADLYLQKVGRPDWSKAMTFQSPNDSSMTYIPFVKENEYRVTATLAVKIKGNDTISTVIFPGKYTDYGFAEEGNRLSAHSIFRIFSRLDQIVFRTQQFIITDNRLLSAQQQNSIEQSNIDINKARILYTLHENASGHRSSSTSRLVETCTRAKTCLMYTFKSAKEEVSVMSQPAPCIWWGEETNCTTYWIDEGEGSAGGGGNAGGGNSGGDWPPVPDPCAPPSQARDGDCDNSPGWEPILAAQIADYQSISDIGDGFDFNVAPDGTFMTFNSVSGFQAYKDAIANPNNTTYDFSTPAITISQNEKIKTAKFNLNFVGGVAVDVRLERINNVWTVKEVESDTWGFTPFTKWDQSVYALSVSGTELMVDVRGKMSYNVIIQGIGTIYKQEFRFRVKFNNITGEIISLSRF